MNCRRCGAIVMGKYCSCCGARLRTDLDEYNAMLRKAKSEFKAQCRLYGGLGRQGSACYHLADACWTASELRYGVESFGSNYVLTQSDIDGIAVIVDRAMLLFRQLMAF